jgi:23S rRNA pseudouridine955/2504/2580 synthase
MSYEVNSEPVVELSKVTHVVVSANDDGQRLDNWLLRVLKGVPRPRIYRLVRKGEVRVNKHRVKPDYRVVAGDDVRIPPIREASEPTSPRVSTKAVDAIESSVIYTDKDVLVIAKPSGLAVHGGSGMTFGVIEALRASRPTETLELAHRLDRDTSGLLLVARNRPALRSLHELLREGRVDKSYLALLKGSWDLGKKTIDAPLATRARVGGERRVRVEEGGKDSDTTFTPVDFFGARATMLEVKIGTGRTHQIRVHAAHTHHPVAGDDKYGDREFNAEMETFGLKRLFLHAQSLSFDWPGTGRSFNVNQPLPQELVDVLDTLSAARKKRRSRR